MAGSEETGDELIAGENNGANDTTRIVGERPEDEPDIDFNGSEILEVVPLPRPGGPVDQQAAENRSPRHSIDGIVGVGWNGNLAFPVINPQVAPMDQARGVIGKGGLNSGTGVEGHGSNLRKGGIGVRGIGGPTS